MKRIILLSIIIMINSEQIYSQQNLKEKYLGLFKAECLMQNSLVSELGKNDPPGRVKIKGSRNAQGLSYFTYYTIFTIKVNENILMTYGFAPYVQDNKGNPVINKDNAFFCIIKREYGEAKVTFISEVELTRLYPENNIFTQWFNPKIGITCIIEDHNKVAYLADEPYDIKFEVGEYEFK